jgi:hypothetical protein
MVTGISSAIWHDWTGTTSTITTGASTYSTDVFTYWVTDSTTTGTDTIYTTWTNEYNQIATFRANELLRTVERQQIEHERNLQLQKEFAEKQQKQLEARRKAKILLLENLDTEQFKDFQKEGFFFVKSPSGRLYRIREGRSINIDLMKDNSRSEVEKRLCGHPLIMCPNEDTMLAQKIYLEKLENDFLGIARSYEPLH